METTTVNARFSSSPTTVTCWLPVFVHVSLDPWAYPTCVWSLFTNNSAGISSSFIPYAIWRKARQHKCSQSLGSFCAARIAFLSDHRRVPWSHLRKNESEQRKDNPSFARLSNISGAIFKMVATTIPRTVTRVTGAAASRRRSSRFVMASTTSG